MFNCEFFNLFQAVHEKLNHFKYSEKLISLVFYRNASFHLQNFWPAFIFVGLCVVLDVLEMDEMVYQILQLLFQNLNRTWPLISGGCSLKGKFTCSKGLFVLIPLPPTNTQLSLKPSMLMLELPKSAIRFLASSFSLYIIKKINAINI